MKQRPETAQPLPRPSWEEVLRLFDVLPDVVFFVKDEQARYVYVNETLLRRVETGGKSALLGRTAREVFPLPGAPGIRSRMRPYSERVWLSGGIWSFIATRTARKDGV